jgi:HEAT repeat protein
MSGRNILKLLRGGDRRSLGRADEVAARVSKNLKLFPALMRGLWDEDPLVRMRAADAAEKVTRAHPKLLTRYKRELFGLMGESEQIEVRWHLAAMITRLPLHGAERELAVDLLHGYLEDRSAIVRTFALQALFDLAKDDAGMRPGVIELLRQATRTGTAAMRARSRKLLPILERM